MTPEQFIDKLFGLNSPPNWGSDIGTPWRNATAGDVVLFDGSYLITAHNSMYWLFGKHSDLAYTGWLGDCICRHSLEDIMAHYMGLKAVNETI